MMMPLAQTPPSAAIPWRVLVPLALAVPALYLLLPKPQRRPVLIASLLGLAAIAVGGILLGRTGAAPPPERLLFYIFSGLAVLGSGIMLTQRKPARAAISFTLVVMSVCGLFLLQGAPFLMAATIIIYAGAIIVTFLFVLMLAQQRGFSDADDRTREPFLATFAGFVLLGTVLVALDRSYPDLQSFDELVDRASVASNKNTIAEIRDVLGDKDAYLGSLYAEERRLRGAPGTSGLYAAVVNVDEELNPTRPDVAQVRLRLRELAAVGADIQHTHRPKDLPAANVAGLGELLYSRHLLAVEIGGALLLVATVGAIAITSRPPRRDA